MLEQILLEIQKAGGKEIDVILDAALGQHRTMELRASADLLPQSCSMKNGKYIQYFRIFHTFACVKISR